MLANSTKMCYTYNTNCKLSQLLCKTTNGVVTKYLYGHGLIGEDKCGAFKTYHFDYRGSTIAITDANGTITDTFAYDTYGKLISRTGTSFVIFGYNGRDGVVTDKNGLIYMRARYYSPEMRRFVNADIVAGEISNAVTLNRFAYANGNPVCNIDPFGLWSLKGLWNSITNWVEDTKVAIKEFGKKAGKAFLNSIEVEAGIGYGFGKSFKAGCFEIEAQAYSDNFTIRLDDDELFIDNSGSAGIYVNILDQKKMSFGVNGSYHHDYVDRPNDCKEHDAWSNPFSVATCEHADKTPMSFSVPIKGSIGADVSEDVVLGISGATHIGVGYHYSVGFNLSQFWRELWE